MCARAQPTASWWCSPTPRCPAVQALIRWDPVTHAQRELSDRAELGFPPAVRMASVTGSAEAVRKLLSGAALPDGGPRSSGPFPPVSDDRQAEGEPYRALVRVPRQAGVQLARALADAQAARSARKDPERLRVQVDPLELI